MFQSDDDKVTKIESVKEIPKDIQNVVEDSILNDENEMMADGEQSEYSQHGQKYRRYIDDESSGSGEGSGDYDVPRKKKPGW